jgi:hypothetical protein
VVLLQSVCRDPDDLDVARCKVWCTASHFAELSRAYRGKVAWVRE